MSKTQEAVENEEQSVLISGMKKRLKEKIQIARRFRKNYETSRASTFFF